MKYFKTFLLSLCILLLTLASTSSYAFGSNTFTYLRCFYRTNASNLTPATTYLWGRDPSSNDYYRINGYWYSNVDLNNMFYSATTQNTLQSVCQSTLTSQGINAPVAMFAAADSSASLNHTVWTLDAVIQNGSINKIVAFGDSLSDMQNMYNATDWVLPNKNSYFAGRFSNDKNWLDYLSANLNLPIYNWAVAGAAADTYFVIPDVSQQVASWVSYTRNAPNYQPQNTLFTLLIGGNDLVNYGRTVATIIAAEQKALTNLIAAGGKNILLVNLPDVSRAPVFATRTDAASVKAQVQQLNQQQADMVATLKANYGSNINIRIFDANSLFTDLLNNPSKYGVNNTTQSCLNINSGSTLNYTYAWSPRSNCTNADTFVFWDLLHPTTHTHKLLGDNATNFARTNFNIGGN